MMVPILNHKGQIEEDSVASTDTEEYRGALFNLQTHRLHNFIVGQWVVMCFDLNRELSNHN
jgi:hypothetical protein